MGKLDYVIRVLDSPLALDAAAWNALLDDQQDGNPFMRHEYLAALFESGSATPASGWTARFMTLTLGGQLVAACPLYVKAHSYGEYVFDWAWANAYQQHGLDYYPKAVVAVPFTPVPGARLLARTSQDRQALVQALLDWCQAQKMSSLHVLFGNEDDIDACSAAGMMQRHTVQFHWKNVAPTLPHFVSSLPPTLPRKFTDFDDFLMSLNQDKRKKIRQERRKVAEAGVKFRWALGAGIAAADWDFFYRCYERTYQEHGNAPYLSPDFFQRMAHTMTEPWLLFVAEQEGTPIATSLIATNSIFTRTSDGFDHLEATKRQSVVTYGRYWGALKRVDCLHFEACYYQPLQWCIEHGYERFEGGAQGEHKMARALMPVKTTSAHWLAHPAFANAVEKFLEREGSGINSYLDELSDRTPFKQG